MENIIRKELKRYDDTINDKNLAKYFNLSKKFDIRLETKDNMKINYIIIYTHQRYKDISDFIKKTYIGLPMEINHIISKYIIEIYFIKIIINVAIPNGYPFSKLVYSYDSVKTNSAIKSDILEYFNYKLNLFNQNMCIDWVPCYSMHNSLLIFMTYIHSDFKHLICYE